jgi:hypothetical protein
MARPKCGTPIVLFAFFLLKNEGKKKPRTFMLLPPSQPQVVFSFRQAYLSQQSTFFFAKKEKCKTKQILWIFICLLKKQDACHVDKLAPSCLPWRDFNDLSNLVRNAHTIKLVVIVRKVLTPHENISMYKTHGTKKKDKKLV